LVFFLEKTHLSLNVQRAILVFDEKPVELLDHQLSVLFLHFRNAAVYLLTGKTSAKCSLLLLILHLLDVAS